MMISTIPEKYAEVQDLDFVGDGGIADTLLESQNIIGLKNL